MTQPTLTSERLKAVSWALFLLLVVASIAVAAAVPLAPLGLLMAVVATIFAYRFPYATLYLGIALTPLLGLMVSLPTGAVLVGARAFGGSIDISLAEVVLLFALVGWAGRMSMFWVRRHAEDWRPRLPLLPATVGLVVAHAASALSPLQPDRVLVAKFAVRPVLLDYLAFVALPVNYIRSRKRLVAALGAFALVSTFAALNGLVAMAFPSDPGQTIGRARPLPFFGISPLGENHNELAELLVVGAPLAWALARLMRERAHARLWHAAAVLQAVMALLTFTRTAWIVLAMQAVFLAWRPFRAQVRAHLGSVAVAAALLLPLGLAMAAYSVSYTARSSTSTRFMLTDIAYTLFTASPVFGAGAGTFVERVGSARVFMLEYGAPLDSHGWLQKVAAETGLVGLLALAVFLVMFARACRAAWLGLHGDRARRTAALLMASAWGGILYQFFNTDYWTGKMWLPIGLALAGFAVLVRIERDILEA